MNKLYFSLHNVNSNFKKQFFSISLLLFLILHIGTNAYAQCDVNPVANQTLCNNIATTAINFTGTATTFNWINNTPSIGLAASGTGNIASFTALNISAAAVTATIAVTPSTGACTGTPINFTITVNPSPVVNVTPTVSCGGIPGIGGNCNPLTASGNADFYIWSPLAGLYTNCTATAPYTGGNMPAVYAAPVVATIYTVTGTISATGCAKTGTATVNNTPPAPNIIPPSVNMCLGDPAVKLRVASGTGFTQFCSGTVSIPVPDNNPAGATSSVTVSGISPLCTIGAMTVTINMPHPRIGNMVFVLKSPNGQVLNLDYHLGATGGTGSTGFVNTVISSVGVTALSTGANPYTGTFKADAQTTSAGGFGAAGPTGMLPTTTNWNSLFAGSVNGNWTLGFYDGVTGDVGTLTSWCLGISYSCSVGVPSNPAVWSPAAGLFFDAASTIPYVAGAPTDSVWARPTPAGVYTYQVTTQGIPVPLCTPTTNFVSNNAAAIVTFNLRNNHPFPIRLFQINSKTANAAQTLVAAYYKTSAVNGLPGVISAANGWNQFGFANITGTGTGIQSFISNLQLVIPAGVTYGICLQATTSGNVPNLAYSVLNPGNYSFNDGGCELITGTNIGYSGTNVPAAPTTALSGFVGSVQFSEASPVCTSPPRSVVVTVGQFTTIITQPVNQTVCIGNSASFSVIVTGTGPFTYQWQLSSNGGASYNNIVNGGVFSEVFTNTLLVNAPPVTMNGNLFRVIINGGSGCSGAPSSAALLTVNPVPSVVISANPIIIAPGQETIIRSTVTPNPAATYTWYLDGVIVPGATADTIVVDINSLGAYQLSVTDVNGCSNLSNIITIAHAFTTNLFVYPNPSTGRFQVRSYSAANNILPSSLVVYNNRGEIVITRNYTQTSPYQKVEIDLRPYGKGIYWIEALDQNGKRLNKNRVVIQ